MNYLFVLILTILVELPVVGGLLWKRAPMRFVATSCLFGNLVSHPFIHLIPPDIFPSLRAHLIGIETTAVAIETIVYILIARPQPRYLAFVAAVAANALSFFLGVWLLGSPW